MKEIHPENIRNVAFTGHQGAGKTTLVESLLHRLGEINRMGSVEEGNTVSDYHADEISRRISISSTALMVSQRGKKYNIIDTPGFTDFISEVISAIRVADSVGLLIHGSAGLEVGTELTWEYCENFARPRFFFLNHLDREHTDFDKLVSQLIARFGPAVPIQFPVNAGGEGFNQIADLLTMKLVTYNPDGGEKSRGDLTGELRDRALELRQKLTETVAETDDELMEKFFENDGLSEDELLEGLRKGLREVKLFPILCGAAKRQVGTSLLVDFLDKIAPNPNEMPPEVATAEVGGDKISLDKGSAGVTAALVFKTVSDKHVGDLSFLRVFSGVVKSGEDLRNSVRGGTEKIGQIFSVVGRNRKAVDEIHAGDIGALVKLRDTHTGDTLSSARDSVVLKAITFPTPLTRVAIVPRNKGDEEKISNAMHILAEEDPSFHFHFDPELAQLIASGQGELHLAVIIDRLKERFGVEVDQEPPKIPYRETIRGASEGQGKYKKQTGGRGQYGDCWLRLEPLARGAGFEFVDAIVGGVIPGKFIPAVEKGVVAAMQEGVISGNQVVDVKVTCYDGSYHTVDSSENAFKVAGSMAFKKVFKDAKPVILEPIYDLEVRVPEEFMGDVMGDVSSKRGKIMGMDRAGTFQIIRAKVPLAELYKYSSTLRSLTGGRGLFKMSFSHYEETPLEIQQKLMADYEARRAEGLG